jgi:hypothetical protein
LPFEVRPSPVRIAMLVIVIMFALWLTNSSNVGLFNDDTTGRVILSSLGAVIAALALVFGIKKDG